jgi:predicted ribosome quality control (RQC) complex YloA/Tae2 family protein
MPFKLLNRLEKVNTENFEEFRKECAENFKAIRLLGKTGRLSRDIAVSIAEAVENMVYTIVERSDLPDKERLVNTMMREAYIDENGTFWMPNIFKMRDDYNKLREGYDAAQITIKENEARHRENEARLAKELKKNQEIIARMARELEESRGKSEQTSK